MGQEDEDKIMERRHIERRTFLKETTAVLTGLIGTNAFAAEKKKDSDEAEWTPLFNGKDLTGWRAEGKAVWNVEDGYLVGVQGPNAAPGDLFTEKDYGDFELRVTYKVRWPANSGVWFRYQAPDKSYQADILEYKNPVAYSGTIYCPGKMFLAVNPDPALEKKDDWNTLLIRAQGDHLVVTLNGVVTGDVHEGSYDKGKIGFQVHPGDEFKDMKITVREVALRPLAS
ncbi:MAG: DUF1080 domain-containing protein [Candidatus Hydrogenedentes bacterium]|nr:DUF1080 domain-containing protein [Candidatus Hydrogenedentota bacterium]